VACPSGYIYNSNFQKCYKFFDYTTTFTNAQAKCVSDGGTLVSIQSQAENDYVYYTIRSSGTYSWIGYNWIGKYWTPNPDRPNLFMTSTYSYTNWENGEGYNRGQDCSAFGMWSTNGKWHDVGCDFQAHFICNTISGMILSLSLLHYKSLLTITTNINI
jgi:hypothetical protein